MFNDLLMGRRAGAGDGRTERRRRRLLDELASGKARGGKRDLTPIDVLSRVADLLELGETMEAIEAARPRPPAATATPELVDGLRRIHKAYAFPAGAYAFVGVDESLLRRAGIPSRRGPGLRRSAGEAPQPVRRRTVA
jgi:hypothetical protein